MMQDKKLPIQSNQNPLSQMPLSNVVMNINHERKAEDWKPVDIIWACRFNFVVEEEQ